MIGYVMTANGTAKNPFAPTAYTSAGTATNVYAVYASPPSRNQVTQLPKARPPRPHSSRSCGLSARRHRAAANPSTVTNPNRARKMANSTRWSARRGISGPPPGELVHERDHADVEEDEGELAPVEERQAEQARFQPVVQRGGQREHDGQQQQPVPAGTPGMVALHG